MAEQHVALTVPPTGMTCTFVCERDGVICELKIRCGHGAIDNVFIERATLGHESIHEHGHTFHPTPWREGDALTVFVKNESDDEEPRGATVTVVSR